MGGCLNLIFDCFIERCGFCLFYLLFGRGTGWVREGGVRDNMRERKVGSSSNGLFDELIWN